MCLGTLGLALALFGVEESATGQPLNLYEWLAVAPVVLSAENLGTYGKLAEFRVEAAHRGQAQAGSLIRVNVRRVNRDRDRLVDEPLRFDEGANYLLLVTPAAKQPADGPQVFEFVRGVRGARPVPSEGADVWREAVERFVALQDQKDDTVRWRAFDEMLESTNPILLETALEQLLKFQRGSLEDIPRLRPLLDHPEAAMRVRTARLLGLIVQRAEGHADGAATVEAELVGKARRDTSVVVRIAATEALHAFRGPTVEGVLEQIAREDPDQNVRYAAERLLYQRHPAGRRVERATAGAAEGGGQR